MKGNIKFENKGVGIMEFRIYLGKGWEVARLPFREEDKPEEILRSYLKSVGGGNEPINDLIRANFGI